jgi:hypothetical protein
MFGNCDKLEHINISGNFFHKMNITGKKLPAPFFRGPLPHPSFADQSANDASANVPNVSQVTFLFWPIARRYRILMPNAQKFRVTSFPHPSFADQSADDASANVPNASQVTSVFWPIASC